MDSNNQAGNIGSILPNISTDDLINKDIFELMGAEKIPEATKNDLMNKMLQIIQGRVMDRIIEMLSEDDYKDLVVALDKNDSAAVTRIMIQNKINPTELFTEEAALLKIEFANITNQKAKEE